MISALPWKYGSGWSPFCFRVPVFFSCASRSSLRLFPIPRILFVWNTGSLDIEVWSVILGKSSFPPPPPYFPGPTLVRFSVIYTIAFLEDIFFSPPFQYQTPLFVDSAAPSSSINVRALVSFGLGFLSSRCCSCLRPRVLVGSFRMLRRPSRIFDVVTSWEIRHRSGLRCISSRQRLLTACFFFVSPQPTYGVFFFRPEVLFGFGTCCSILRAFCVVRPVVLPILFLCSFRFISWPERAPWSSTLAPFGEKFEWGFRPN